MELGHNPAATKAAATFARGMAEKPRVKAPKQRSTSKPEGAARKRRTLLVAVVAGVIAVGVVAVVALAGFGGGTTDARAALETAGCTLQIAPGGTPSHSILDPNGRSKKWNTFPPTSGPHYGEPAIFGAYDTPLQQARVIHNLEHGGVFIQYGSKVPQATIAELQAFYDKHKPGTLLSPLPGLGNKIALGAWVHTNEDLAKGTNGHGYLAKCTRFDEAAFAAFLHSYQFKGSHVNNPSLMLPGE
jgi:hypothetical protein